MATILGTANNDVLEGGSTNDFIFGFGGDDTLKGGAGSDILNGGTGEDLMEGGAGNDAYVLDTPGDRVIEGADQGSDWVYANFDYVLGDNLERLTLRGTAFRGEGNSLDNAIFGNDGRNYLLGGAGDDVLIANGDNDVLDGGVGNDRLNGGTGIDLLTGGNGDDLLFGGADDDILIGGAGADGFTFFSPTDGDDRLVDFNKAEGDFLRINTGEFGSSLVVGDLDASQFVLGSAATGANEQFVYNPTNGSLSFDADGVGGAAAVQFATFSLGVDLTSSDFVLV